MSKLTLKQKKEIYTKRNEGYSFSQLSQIYSVREDNIRYLCRLIDYHGFGILRDGKIRVYSNELKEQIINEVLIDRQSITLTSLKYGLSSNGILVNWIKSYKENDYTVVNRKKGRKHKMTKKPKSKRLLTDQDRLKALEEENHYLKTENAYLKKLKVVVEQREKRLKEKKQQ